MLSAMQTDVLAFHRFFGLDWSPRPIDLAPERKALRRSLIAEENSELWLAVSRFDMIETADGICDLLYVTLGTRVEFGLPPPPAIALRLRPSIAFPDAKIELPAFKQAFLRRIADLSLVLSATTASLSAIDSATENVARACCGLSAAFGLPFPLLWAKVHSSNMTKAERPAHGEGCPLTRDPETGRSQACICGAVLYREDGKLLKGRGFRPPDIAGILAAAGYVQPQASQDSGGTLFSEGPERPATVADVPAMRGK